MVAAAVVAAGVVGAAATAYSSSNAADAQSAAGRAAIGAQQQQQAQTRADLQQYNDAGTAASHWLNYLTGTGTGGDPTSAYFGPVKMDQATLEQTPGYQFNLTQGLKATQNSAAARGLGVSGAALKGAATYATGLADSTYQNQFNNEVTNRTNVYNRLMGLSTLGENAAAQTGAMGTQTAANIGNNLVGIGNAQAAASMATGNSISGGANSAGQSYMLNKLLSGGGGAGGLYGSQNSAFQNANGYSLSAGG